MKISPAMCARPRIGLDGMQLHSICMRKASDNLSTMGNIPSVGCNQANYECCIVGEIARSETFTASGYQLIYQVLWATWDLAKCDT